MPKRKRRPNGVPTQRKRAKKVQLGGPLKKPATLKSKQSNRGQTNREKQAQKPQGEWVTFEHRDADGNTTFPRELIATTFHRRYEEVPKGTKIKVLVLAGYNPKALMMVERKIYEIHRLSVQGWRRGGQITVEMEGWRQHEVEWFNAMRGVEVEVLDPGLPDTQNVKANYIVANSSFQRKFVALVGEGGSRNEIQMHQGTLEITETWRSAWRRQETDVLNKGFKYFLIPLLCSLLSGLAVWWIVSPDGQDSALPENPKEQRLSGNTDNHKSGPSVGWTDHPPVEIPASPTEILKRDSTSSAPQGELNADGATSDGKKESGQASDTTPANVRAEGNGNLQSTAL